MKKHSAAAAALFACLLPFTAQAEKFALRLTGFQETPLTLSSPASGEFEARISQNDDSITWELSYRDFPTSVLQAHIHFGQRATTGGISIFLCSNLGNGPAGTLACPQMGTIGGVITAANVIGPAAQGIAAGDAISRRRNPGTVPPQAPGSRPRQRPSRLTRCFKIRGCASRRASLQPSSDRRLPSPKRGMTTPSGSIRR
jgi:CHRD domain-containing protein